MISNSRYCPSLTQFPPVNCPKAKSNFGISLENLEDQMVDENRNADISTEHHHQISSRIFATKTKPNSGEFPSGVEKRETHQFSFNTNLRVIGESSKVSTAHEISCCMGPKVNLRNQSNINFSIEFDEFESDSEESPQSPPAEAKKLERHATNEQAGGCGPSNGQFEVNVEEVNERRYARYLNIGNKICSVKESRNKDRVLKSPLFQDEFLEDSFYQTSIIAESNNMSMISHCNAFRQHAQVAEQKLNSQPFHSQAQHHFDVCTIAQEPVSPFRSTNTRPSDCRRSTGIKDKAH